LHFARRNISTHEADAGDTTLIGDKQVRQNLFGKEIPYLILEVRAVTTRTAVGAVREV